MIDDKKKEKLISRGKRKGFLTLDQIYNAFPEYGKDASISAEIETVLDENNIKIRKVSNIREWIESIVIAFILAMFIRTFFIQAYKIPSGSMRMTLIEGDRLMVNKLKYGPKIPFTSKRLPGISKFERGDIIVFKFPLEPKRDFIKRLIALGGETVEIKNNDIYINDQRVEDQKIKNIVYYNRGDYGAVGEKTVVPEGMVFVLGDNSQSSHDSRYWGFVPVENIIGKAEIIYWPFNRMRILE